MYLPMRENTSALSIPDTLILRWDDCSTRPVRVKAQDRRLYVPRRHGSNTPQTSQLWAVAENFLAETELGLIWDSNPGPPILRPYTLVTRPWRLLKLKPIYTIKVANMSSFYSIFSIFS
ncbi:unnamed protein product, partial [Brenthis ino]